MDRARARPARRPQALAGTGTGGTVDPLRIRFTVAGLTGGRGMGSLAAASAPPWIQCKSRSEHGAHNRARIRTEPRASSIEYRVAIGDQGGAATRIGHSIPLKRHGLPVANGQRLTLRLASPETRRLCYGLRR